MHSKSYRFSEYQYLSLVISLITLRFVSGAPPMIDQSLNLFSNAVDVVCTSTISLYSALQLEKPHISNMHFRHITDCRNFSVPLEDVNNLLKHNLFDREKKVVILAAGWQNTVNRSITLAKMSRAFLCRNDVNLLFVDVASYMDTNYKWAAINTQELGKFLAIGLKNLIKIIPLRNIHLIGHSLGAHIMASAGRTFTNLTNGLRIPRITGLDPANPCFGDENKMISLGSGDAEFVDIIHTNIGILGIREPIGDIDFYPGGAKYLQPGCNDIQCSHSRAVDYFVESVYPKQETNFPTHKCRAFEELQEMKCSKQRTNLYMGLRSGNRNFGIFYVDINEKYPFGKNSNTTRPVCQRQRRVVCG